MPKSTNLQRFQRTAKTSLLMGYVTLLSANIAGPVEAAISPLAGPPLVLAQDGRTHYVIAVATDAIPAEQTAARELSEYLEKISGAKFVVMPESEVGKAQPQILVGAGTRVKQLLPKQDWDALGKNGTVIQTVGRNLILAGGRPRGSLYAVYSFLEDKLGVRWWTPESSTVPTQRLLKLAPQSTVYVPKLQTREVYSPGVQRDAVFATRLKINGHHQRQGADLGGHDSIVGWVHTFSDLLPIAKYFKEHPEWYSDPANGGKPCTAASAMPKLWQPCLANEAARQELTQNVLKTLRANPNATSISISQNDNMARCRCDAEQALEQSEGSPSGPMLRFVNAVAAEVEKEFPHVLVDTLAYQYTQPPPRTVRPRRNVVIRFCTIDADFAQPMDSPANARYNADIKAWSAIAPRLAMWDYITNFANFVLPYPNMPVLAKNVRFFADHNAISLFEQSDARTNETGDFVALRAWLMGHLMWDPSRDQRQLEGEFLTGYYGAAAPHLRAYLDTIQTAGAGYKLGWLQDDVSYLTLDVMTNATRHFRAALAAVAEDPELTKRVLREKLALDHGWLLRYKTLKREAERRKIAFEGPADPAAEANAFVAALRANGVQATAEAETMEAYAKRLLLRFATTAPLPAFLVDKDDYDIIDSQENVFRLTNVGKWVTVVDDPKASNGKAARLPGTVGEWAIQYHLEESDSFLGKDPWRCYVVARAEVKPGTTTGDAMAAGIYDNRNKVERLTTNVALESMPNDGKYHVVDLGAQPLHSGMYLWFACKGRAEVEGVNIDRIILVREKVAVTGEK